MSFCVSAKDYYLVLKVLNSAGKYTYSNNWPINNGIRSPFEALNIAMQCTTIGDNGSIFYNKKPSFFGIDDCANEKAAIPDIIVFHKNGDKIIGECVTSLHTIGNTDRFDTAMAYKEIKSLEYKLNEHQADKGLVLADKSVDNRNTICKLQKIMDKCHKDTDVMVLGVNTSSLLNKRYVASIEKLAKDIIAIRDFYNKLYSILFDKEQGITANDVLKSIYILQSIAWGGDLKKKFDTKGLDCTCFKDLAEETGISVASLHLFFEKDCKDRFYINKLKNVDNKNSINTRIAASASSTKIKKYLKNHE